MANRKCELYCADFETTVYEGQTDTEVWASAIVNLDKDKVIIHHSIDEFMEYVLNFNKSSRVYFHNLKFDGSFILQYLIRNNFTQAFDETQKPIDDNYMKKHSFKYLITDLGEWYYISVRSDTGHRLEFYDSYKLLPFSIEMLGKCFDTEHKKLSMKYEGRRYAGCNITRKEKEYIKNDVLVLKESLIQMFNRGNTKLTIGSCCLSEYKRIMGKTTWQALFPTCNIAIPEEYHFPDVSVDSFIRASYKGGYCYLKRGCENKKFHKGIVADVNSLYPSMMLSDRPYPTGNPIWWEGDYIPKEAESRYYFVRVKTRFYLKEGKLPCIQIKNSNLYPAHDWLETSDIWNKTTQEFQSEYINIDGEKQDTSVTITLTCTDWKLMQEHYILIDTEIIGGCYFMTRSGNELFYEYLWFYKDQKINATNPVDRTIAKLFSNNLYGKLATSTNSSYKLAYLEDGVLKFNTKIAFDKEPVYIPAGSAITSYAREFTIRHAQENYDHFIYADTDSIHCNCGPEDLIDIDVDEKEYSHWKLEASFDSAIYVRQKSYIEHVIAENLEECEPYYNVKYAGLGKRAKLLLRKALGDNVEIEDITADEKKFLNNRLDITDVKPGLVIPSNLKAKNIKGGILLYKSDMVIR